METTEAKNAVNAILATHGITMQAAHVPSSYDPKSKAFQGIAWRITFERAGRKFETDYRQGVGHLPNYVGDYNKPSQDYPRAATVAGLEIINATLQTGRVHRYSSGHAAPTGKKLAPPEPADVVGCLILDASAADCETYEEWARDTGYGEDSREGERIFNACRKTALDLNRVFGAAVVEELREPAGQL